MFIQYKIKVNRVMFENTKEIPWNKSGIKQINMWFEESKYIPQLNANTDNNLVIKFEVEHITKEEAIKITKQPLNDILSILFYKVDAVFGIPFVDKYHLLVVSKLDKVV
ncbi:hypothetical protein [Priestia endophytica]|uniref:hypothetical protein n=1 Tax=Priestia endophytica TaxID=135735 RepID=UPI000DCA826B|nr:hypothetical protein [Priestia endophytica]RAS75725.1 hypothetical protein A4R27_22000 [Priestia endophytica]